MAGLLGFVVLRLARPIPTTAYDEDEAEEIFAGDAEREPRICVDDQGPVR